MQLREKRDSQYYGSFAAATQTGDKFLWNHVDDFEPVFIKARKPECCIDGKGFVFSLGVNT